MNDLVTEGELATEIRDVLSERKIQKVSMMIMVWKEYEAVVETHPTQRFHGFTYSTLILLIRMVQ